MGLDTYFHLYDKDERQRMLNSLDGKEDEIGKEILYWRKEYELDEWWANRTGVDNCEYGEVTEDDIKDFIEYLKETHFEYTSWRNKKEQKEFIEETISQFQKILDETNWELQGIKFIRWY
jgi:hypothetical protein